MKSAESEFSGPELLPVAILAGGLATRLGRLTHERPKALLEVAGCPFIDHQLRLLKAAGAGRVVLCLGHLGEMIQAYVGDGRRFGLTVEYSHDGPVQLGTGGALRQALPLLGGAFFVLYGDSYLTCDYRGVQRVFEAGRQPALMTVYRNRNLYDQSNVIYRAGRVVAYSKTDRREAMEHIDYGLGVLTAEAFNSGEVPSDLADLYSDLAAAGRLAGMEIAERFFEIGSLEGLAELDGLLRPAGSSNPAI